MSTYSPNIDSLGINGGFGGGYGGFMPLLLGLLIGGDGGFFRGRDRGGDGCGAATCQQLFEATNNILNSNQSVEGNVLRGEGAILTAINANENSFRDGFANLVQFLCGEFRQTDASISQLKLENSQQTNTILSAIESQKFQCLQEKLLETQQKASNAEMLLAINKLLHPCPPPHDAPAPAPGAFA